MSKIQSALQMLKSDRSTFMAAIIQNFFGWLPDKTYLQLLYRFKMGHRLDLNHPKTFTEKIQWLKLYNRRPEYTHGGQICSKKICGRHYRREIHYPHTRCLG